MTFDAATLYNLLPAIYRIRDAETAAATTGLLSREDEQELRALEGLSSLTPDQQARLDTLGRWRALEQNATGPLKSLLMAFADEIGVIEEDLDQLYDDLFIETCAPWVIPYIGDLIGYEPLHSLGKTSEYARAEVAHTIAMRRRKGTAAVLEQLAYDVTGWQAHAVEFFQLLGATQYMNHLRPHSRYSPDMRKGEVLARIGGAFDSVAHTVDVRSVERRKGRFNIPNIGLFLWRIDAYSHTRSRAVRVDERRYLISPLGHPLQLYHSPQREEEITHLAEAVNVPEPIRRRSMSLKPGWYYGLRESAGAPVDNSQPSIVLFVDGLEIKREQVAVCNLSDYATNWAHPAPEGKYAIDPELGRIAVAPDLDVPQTVEVSYHYGFSADMGGGEYPRPRPDVAAEVVIHRVPTDYPTIAAALTALAGDGVVEIVDSGRYEETLSITIDPGAHVVLRSAELCLPVLILGDEMTITGEENSRFSMEGLLVAGNRLRVPETGNLAQLSLSHSTLVPGLGLDAAGNPVSPGEAGLIIEQENVVLTLNRTIMGPLRVSDGSTATVSDAIIDATSAAEMAYAAEDSSGPGGKLSLDSCTVIGRIRAAEAGTISNCLLVARAGEAETMPPVHVVRRQVGCVRFTWLPVDSVVPRRYHCLPGLDGEGGFSAPHFASLRYGTSSYCQLERSTPEAIRRGADDESEMGAFHSLYPAQREENLQARLREYLRVGLIAGIFYES